MFGPFSIQVTATEAMVWVKTYDGRKVCVYVCEHRFEAVEWIKAALAKMPWLNVGV
jgi:hypothetical protein